MPRVRSSHARQGTRPGTRRPRRRRASVRTRIRYQRPSARNQRSQLATIAKMALRNSKMLNSTKIYTDWFQNANVTGTDTVWNATPLMEFRFWDAGNRQDAAVSEIQSAYLRNMVLEWTFQSYLKNRALEVDIFVVSLRSSSSTWVPQTEPTGSLGPDDFKEMGFNNAPQLNSGIFKVHYHKHMRLFPVNFQATNVLEYSGNPLTTYRRGQVNLKLGYKARSPDGTAWKELEQGMLPARQRLYLLHRAQCEDTLNQYRFTWGTHTTVVTTS